MTGLVEQQYGRTAAFELKDTRSPHLLLLLHGLGGDRDQPLGLTADRFASLGVSLLAPDARAHGQTVMVGGPDRFTTANLARDVLSLVERLGLGDRILVPIGISMGAAVGLEIVTQHASRVGAAVLIRPSFGPEPWPGHLRVFHLLAELLGRRGSAGLDEFTRTPEYREHLAVSASAAASLREQFTKPLAAERVVRLETVPGNVAVDWAGAQDFGVPIMIIGANGDPGHPLAVARLWHDRLGGSRLVEVPSRDQEPASYAAAMAQGVIEAVQAVVHPGAGLHRSE